MPEEIEIDTDKLREAIDEEIERESGKLLRTVALTTALFAALAAITALKAGGTVNEALILKTEATGLKAEASNNQNKASDQWAYYQAKGLKATITEAEENVWLAFDKKPPDELAAKLERYAEDQKKSMEQAKEFEKQRDEQIEEAKKHSAEADELMHHHHLYAQAVALLQVAIALGAIAALTRRRLVWIGSTLLGLTGAAVFGFAFFGS